ncbi:hypothetical protein FRB91_003976 [Serendipita sp. 411]|nr:hypothetical protein FRB91_003976 [Serendipita sp. 411]
MNPASVLTHSKCTCGKGFDSQRKLNLHRARSAACKRHWMAEVAAFIPHTDTQKQLPNPDIEGESGSNCNVEICHQNDPLISPSISDYSSSCDDELMDGDDSDTDGESIPNDNPDEILGYGYHNDDVEGVSPEFVPDQANVGHDPGMEICHNNIYEEPEVESDDKMTGTVEASQLTSASRNLSEPSDNGADIYIENYPEAGRVFSRIRSKFQDDSEIQINTGKGNLHYPFANEMDHELGLWLHESGLSVSKIDSFLKLQYVQARKPSFGSGAGLRDRIELLPHAGSRWKEAKITPECGRPASSVTLLYWDPLQTIRELISRPSLAEYIEFSPKRIWSDATKTSRIYSEMTTGNWWWNIQANLPQGSTVVPVILGSDKTHLTEFTGDKKAWPIYMSVGNISSRARRTPSKDTWIVIAYIPTTKWKDDTDIHGTLNARLFHQCMEVVLEPLIDAGRNGINLADWDGNVRRSFPLVAAYLADYPEQILVNCAAGKTGPTTLAGPHDLGNILPSAPQTTEWVLRQIKRVAREVDPRDVKSYTSRARKRLLNGVDRPFWRHLPHFRVDICTAPDLFHGAIRFWRDHLFRWIVHLIGEAELDARLKVLQPMIGFRHFAKGVTHLSQWTGREDREIQRVFVALIAGAKGINPTVMRNARAFHDFLYLVQYRSHSNETLGYITDALSTFHETKAIYIEMEARRGKNGVLDHFDIPKMAVFHTFVNHIKELGSAPQFSTEIVERNHKPGVKQPYRASSRRGYNTQMCRFLDRKERIRYTKELITWTLQQQERQLKDQAIGELTPGFQDRIRASILAPSFPLQHRPPYLRERRQGATLWLNRSPHYTRLTLTILANVYSIPSLQQDVDEYLRSNFDLLGSIGRQGVSVSDIMHIDVWENLHIRTADVQDEAEPSPQHTLHALPPGAHNGLYPYGHGHCVLIHDSKEAQDVGIEGYCVAQLLLIFRVHFSPESSFDNKNDLFGFEPRRIHPHTNPRRSAIDLAYVRFLKVSEEPDRDILMYRAQCAGSKRSRRGTVIELDAIARFIQLIPRFGSRMNRNITAETSMELHSTYYINSFATSQIFQAVY